jgi:ectoine hydroxylase-related dioxygenase (phytanoyl-CoA dioxygenase family)
LLFLFVFCQGNINNEDGRLALLPRTHKLKTFNAPKTKGMTPGEYSEQMEQTQTWHTDIYSPGDIVLFNIKLIHAATQNTSQYYRISVDTRVTVNLNK